MLILALVLLTSSAGVYFVSVNFVTNLLLLQGCATLYTLLTVAGIAVFVFEIMILPWREHGCELTIFDVVRDVKRKLFKL